jgi:hypothetical protein
MRQVPVGELRNHHVEIVLSGGLTIEEAAR